jgi:hypothetical protein
MVKPVHADRIALPPVLLTVVPFVTMPVAVVVAINIFPSAWGALVCALLGFAVPLLWLVKRVRP